MDTFIKFIVVCVFAVAGYFVGALFMAIPTMLLVNHLFTPNAIFSLFGVTSLTVWKAWMLNFVCAMLFKSSTSLSSSK